MLGRGVLSRLHCLTQQESPTLTLYLDIDQNKQSNRNRGYVVQAEALLKDLRARHGDDGLLARASELALAQVAELAAQGKAAVVVVHPDSKLCEIHQAHVGLATSAHWGRGAFLRPVVEAMDEHECYGVVLTDSKRARLFTVDLGSIVEHEDVASDTEQRTSSLGADQMRAQKRRDRHHDEAVASHTKKVIDALHDLSIRRPFDRLIVAGPTKAAAQLVRLLPRRLRGKLVETVSMAVTAPASEVLAGILAVQERMERRQELELVDGLQAELHEGGKAVAGLEAVLDAAADGRVWKLFYPRGLDADGSECRACGGLSQKLGGACDRCREADLEPLQDLVDRLAQQVLDSGGKVEMVAGEASERLAALGGMAALVRY